MQRRDEEHEADARERLDNEKRAMLGEINAGRQREQAESAQTHEALLLKELDELRDEDPDAFSQRVTNDAQAAQALANRNTPQVPADMVNYAKIALVTEQAKQMFGARPELEALTRENGEEWQKAIDPATHGIFGYIARAGTAEGVETFKSSKQYTDEVEKAEQRGRQNALSEAGIGSPPSNDDSTPTEEPATTYDDIRQQAAADALRELRGRGKRLLINPSDIPKRKRTVR